MAMGPGGLNPTLPVELLCLGVIVVVVYLDARRRAEDLFLGNLGVSGWAIAAFALPLALIAELLVP
jgi:hypothetical protein